MAKTDKTDNSIKLKIETDPYTWQNIRITACILITIIVLAIKDSLISNPKVFSTSDDIV